MASLLVSGSFPDRLNRNRNIRAGFTAACRDILGDNAVHECAFEDCRTTIRRLTPETVILIGSFLSDSEEYGEISSACGTYGGTLGFWFHEDPYEFDYSLKYAHLADLVFSSDRFAVAFLNHPHAYHLPTAADAIWAGRNIKSFHERTIDFFFCGVGYPNRIRVLEACRHTLSRYNTVVLGDGWPASLPFCSNIRITSDELMALYSNARITLNLCRQLNLANMRHLLDPSTPGPRTFEAAIAGTVQAYFVNGLEIGDYFEVGTEITLFNDGNELEKILALMIQSPEEYMAIASAARKRALGEHTYRHRAESALRQFKAIRKSRIHGKGRETGTIE